MITYAAANIDQVSKHGQTELHGGAGCVMKVDTSAAPEDAQGSWKNTFYSSDNKAWPLLDHREGEEGADFSGGGIYYRAVSGGKIGAGLGGV